MMKMMRKIGIWIMAALLFAACEKDLPMFSGEHCVDFVLEKDSIIYSFAFNPTIETGEIKVPIEIMGPVEDFERTYRYEVDPASTARKGIDYEELPLQGKIAAGRVTDTIRVKVLKNEEMASKAFTLFLKLVPSEDFGVGLAEKTMVKMFISDILTQPEWWDVWYTDNVLGNYSDKKYRYFIEIMGISDLSELELYKMRTTVLKFKYHIEAIRKQASEETDPVKKAQLLEEITDEDGTIMNIPLRGSLPDREDY